MALSQFVRGLFSRRASRSRSSYNSRSRPRLFVEPLEDRVCPNGSWSNAAPMPAARAWAVAAPINSTLYVVAGHTSHETPTLQAYNPSTNTWTTLADMPAGRYGGDGAAVINGKLYVPGGWDNSYSFLPHSDLFIYDPSTNTWSSGANMPRLSACGASAAINGKLYVTTPCNGFNGFYTFLDVYDPASNSWSNLASSPHVHAVPVTGVIGGKFYVASGSDESDSTGYLDIYDPATNTWATAASMPFGVNNAAGAVLNGKLYVVGGYATTSTGGGGATLATVEVYDPLTNIWTTDTSMPTPRAGLVAGVVNGILYAAGGQDSNGNILATNEAFMPAGAVNLRVSGLPSSATAGVAQSITVTALDPFGNIASGYTGTVHFTSSDRRGALPANYTFTAGDGGVRVFSPGVVLVTAGTQTVTATDTLTATLTNTSSAIKVSPAALNRFKVTAPAGSAAGAAFSITVTALDAFNNTVTGYVGTVHFTSTDGQAVLPFNYTFTTADKGVHTFSKGVTLKTADRQSVTATDTVTNSVTGRALVAVTPAQASTFLLSAPSSVTHGVAFTFTITALDPYGNVATGYRGSVHFSSSDAAAILPQDCTFTSSDAGMVTLSAILNTTGNQSLTGTDTLNSGLSGTDKTIQVG
jgi:N-acetylneuraminic acid mutarotase